MAPVSMILSDH